AEKQGAFVGMAAADARAAVLEMLAIDDTPGKAGKLLRVLGLWCIRYTPFVSVDLPDGLLLDISGCAHLWGGERGYLKEIVLKLRNAGFDARAAVIAGLPPAALRLEGDILDKLLKLGFRSIGPLLSFEASVLRRRFT